MNKTLQEAFFDIFQSAIKPVVRDLATELLKTVLGDDIYTQITSAESDALTRGDSKSLNTKLVMYFIQQFSGIKLNALRYGDFIVPSISQHRVWGDSTVTISASNPGINLIFIDRNNAYRTTKYEIDARTVNQLAYQTKEQRRDCLVFLAALAILGEFKTEQTTRREVEAAAAAEEAKKEKRRERAIKRRQDKYSEGGDWEKMISDAEAGINTDKESFYFALGFLAATIPARGWIKAKVPVKDGDNSAVRAFERMFPGAPYEVHNVVRVGNWDDMYGTSFALKIPEKAVPYAPSYLTNTLQGTAYQFFGHSEHQNTAGALNRHGILSNMGFITKLINDYGFNFGVGEKAVPSIDKLKDYYCPGDKADFVQKGYDRGLSALNGSSDGGSDDASTDEPENPLDIDFPEVE